jgi:integrase/recombinase XerD
MIRQSRNGERWEVYGRRNGVKVYIGTFDSKREAESAERRHIVTQEQIADGEIPEDTDVKRTLDESLDAWLEHIKAQRSHDEYEGRMALYVRKALGAMPLVKFRRKTITDWRASLQGQISNRSINCVKATLTTAFEYFVHDRGWLAENPCRGIDALPVLDKSFEWIRTTEDITRLLAHCPLRIRPIVALLVGTGMRVNEALYLQWQDIDLEHRLIHVQRGRRGPPKSGHMRHVPIFDSALSVLRELKLQRGENVAGLLFPGTKRNTDGSPKPLSRLTVRDPFKRACVRAGLPERLRIHDMRHTFAGLYLVDGGDIFRLSKILGHSSVQITQSTYGHLRPDAFTMDYRRIAFRMPSEGSAVPMRAA